MLLFMHHGPAAACDGIRRRIGTNTHMQRVSGTHRNTGTKNKTRFNQQEEQEEQEKRRRRRRRRSFLVLALPKQEQDSLDEEEEEEEEEDDYSKQAKDVLETLAQGAGRRGRSPGTAGSQGMPAALQGARAHRRGQTSAGKSGAGNGDETKSGRDGAKGRGVGVCKKVREFQLW